MATFNVAHNAQFQQLTFEHGFKPIYYFLRVFGLWPFSICHNSKGAIQCARIGRLDGVWFFISMCLRPLAMFYFFVNVVDEYKASSTNKNVSTFEILYILFRLFSLFIGLVGIILDMHHRYKLVNVLENFTIFDNEVS